MTRRHGRTLDLDPLDLPRFRPALRAAHAIVAARAEHLDEAHATTDAACTRRTAADLHELLSLLGDPTREKRPGHEGQP